MYNKLFLFICIHSYQDYTTLGRMNVNERKKYSSKERRKDGTKDIWIKGAFY